MKEEKSKPVLAGELLLVIGVFLDAMGIVFMLYSGAGMTAGASVSYALFLAFPALTQGTWMYLFQGALVMILFLVGRKLNWSYLFSFVVGFFFGIAVDFHKMWIETLPTGFAFRVAYFLLGFAAVSFSVALMNRCLLPIIPADLFSREMSRILQVPYMRVRLPQDITCLSVTLFLTVVFTGRPQGIGVGTVIAAFTLGKAIAWFGERMDRRFTTRLVWLRGSKKGNAESA